jgi:hypothetical protein
MGRQKEASRVERAAMAKATLQSLQQLKEHLTATLTGLKAAQGGPHMLFGRNKHRHVAHAIESKHVCTSNPDGVLNFVRCAKPGGESFRIAGSLIRWWLGWSRRTSHCEWTLQMAGSPRGRTRPFFPRRI